MIIIPGTNATLTDNTIEQQLLKGLLLLNLWEKNSTFNPDEKEFIGATFDTEDLSWQISFSLPCSQVINTSGSPTIIGENYLSNTPFTPGNPKGTFKSSSLPAYCTEVIMTAQIWENNSQYNPNAKNNITAVFNSDRNVLTGTATILCDFAVQPNVSTIAREYLNVGQSP